MSIPEAFGKVSEIVQVVSEDDKSDTQGDNTKGGNAGSTSEAKIRDNELFIRQVEHQEGTFTPDTFSIEEATKNKLKDTVFDAYKIPTWIKE